MNLTARIAFILRDWEGPSLLVRPDHHVAWRSDDPPLDPSAVLSAVTWSRYRPRRPREAV